MDITFALKEKRQDPKNKDYQFLLANRIAAMLLEDKHTESPPRMEDDCSSINIHPWSNNTFLILPGHHGLSEKEFRLASKYGDDETLKAVITLLQNCT